MTMRTLIRLAVAALLGVSAAVLVSCGSSGKGLIPLANAGPLQSDFEAVAQAARSGDGNCTATTEAINKTEQDFAALPSTIDPGLRQRLSKGISNLRSRALALCAQPLAQTTTTNAPPHDHDDGHENPDPAAGDPRRRRRARPPPRRRRPHPRPRRRTTGAAPWRPAPKARQAWDREAGPGPANPAPGLRKA